MPNKFFGNHTPEFVHQSWLSFHPSLANQGSGSIGRNINILLTNIYFMVIKKYCWKYARCDSL